MKLGCAILAAVLLFLLQIKLQQPEGTELASLTGVNYSIDQFADRMQGVIDSALEAGLALGLQVNTDAKESISDLTQIIKKWYQ